MVSHLNLINSHYRHHLTTITTHRRRGLDDTGRDIGDVVAKVKQYLAAKGMIVYLDENRSGVTKGMKDMGLVGRITVSISVERYIERYVEQ
jgi:hypothetical protein